MFLSQQVRRNVTIINKNGKCELAGELSNHVRINKISKLQGIIVQCPDLFPKWKYWQL